MRLKQYIKEEKKKTSAAVLMTNGEKFLAIHPTGWGGVWEIPKGNIDKGENEKQAAVREFYEEVGVKINISGLKKVGKFPLHPRKDVVLFIYSTDKLPPTSAMKSLSTFHPNKYEGDFKTTAPETNNWKYITLDQMKKYIRPEMHTMIRKAME